MSDYQRVRVAAVEGRTVVLDVLEDHPDMDALASIIEGGRLVGDHAGRTKIGAELVLEHRSCQNAMVAAALAAHAETGAWPTQSAFVSDVALRACKVVGTSSAGQPRYHAMLEITLTRSEYAAELAIDDEYGSVATPTGIDVELRDFWDHI